MQSIEKTFLDDISVFRFQNRNILYSPLDRILLSLEDWAFDYLENNKTREAWKSTIDPDGEYGLFSSPMPEIDEYISEKSYDGVVLLLTDVCNMNCKYCYASDSQNHGQRHSDKIWKNALDIAIRKLKKNIEIFSVAFHGYGECSTQMESIRTIVFDVKKRINNTGLKPQFQITSNGTFSPEDCAWMIEEGFRFDISIDGDRDVNDIMRLNKRGQSEHATIVENIKIITGSNCIDKLTTRATVTSRTVSHMVESLEFLGSLNVPSVHFEPITPRGNAISLGDDYAPDIFEFVENYKKCIISASDLGMKVYYGPINFGLAVRFCSSRNKLVVDHLGRVLGCLQAGPNSGLDLFHYGSIENGYFNVFDGKREGINSICVYSQEKCKTCLLKFHCSGDCQAHNIDVELNPRFKKNKCSANESLFAWILDGMLSGEKIDSVLDFELIDM